MKIVKTASGKKTIKMSKKEWQSIGKTAGWVNDSDIRDGKTPNDKVDEMKEKGTLPFNVTTGHSKSFLDTLDKDRSISWDSNGKNNKVWAWRGGEWTKIMDNSSDLADRGASDLVKYIMENVSNLGYYLKDGIKTKF